MREVKFNVLSHEVKATHGENGHSDPMQGNEQGLESQGSKWLDFKSLLSGEMTLAVRSSTGEPAVLKVPHTILAVLVVIALACISGGFWLVSSVTEMKTNLATIKENQRELKQEQFSNLKLMIAYSTNETNRINFMTGLLSEEKRRELYEYDANHPRPQLPEPKKQEREEP